MSLWAAFATGLLAGGASCAAVQGGLLAGVVARRREPQPVAPGRRRTRPAPQPTPGEDVVPVAGFLAGKLVSHAALGAALGALGSAVSLGFQARAILQIAAGLVMLILAADLLGLPAARRLVPKPPATWGRLVRRSGRWGGGLAPAALGAATILIPCGVTLSMEFLAIASGSPLQGAGIMAAFVLGTSPLFAALGYAARRSATALRGRLAVLAGVAVLVAGVWSINAGLTLQGSSFTVASAWRSLQGAQPGPTTNVPVATDGQQQIVITVRSASYSPSRSTVRAGVPTTLVLRSVGARGCTSAIVFPTLGVERMLPAQGDTVIEVGPLRAGTHRFSCAMGMYGGTIEATS